MPSATSGAARRWPEMRPRVVELLNLALLPLERRHAHGPAINARRRPGLEPAGLEPRLEQLFREVCGGGLARPPAGEHRRGADVNPAPQEGAGGNDHAARTKTSSLERLDPAHDTALEEQSRDGALDGEERGMSLQQRPHRPPVEPAIALRARRPDRWPLAPVEHAELECRQIGRPSHEAAERIHLAHHRAFGDAADSRVARHLADGLERARHDRRAGASARGRDGGFRSRVARANDDDVELRLMAGMRALHRGKITMRFRREPGALAYSQECARDSPRLPDALGEDPRMPITIAQGEPTLIFRRAAYERAGLTRASLDTRLGLTDTEFVVSGDIVALGPIYDVDALGTLVDELEQLGLVFYDDFFEMSGGWPEWLVVLAKGSGAVTA